MKPTQFATVLIFIFFICRFSFADGVYIPEVRKKIPEIPVQRAVVKYLNGVETLIIESTFDGEGNNFGWVIPVPNKPSELEKLSPGLLKTLSFQLQPKIEQKKRKRRVYGIRLEYFFLISIGFICIFTISLGWQVGLFLWGLTIIAFIVNSPLSMVYRDGSSPSLNKVNPVEIQSRQIIGDYEIFVLKAGESEDLRTWLEDNGFRPFPEKAFATIDDYLEQKWYFVAVKLTREHDDISVPHPLLIEFETDRPVYPMRLTALQDAEVNIELFVIAEAQAVPVGYRLKKEYCNTFYYRKISSWYHRNTYEKVYGFKGRKYFGKNMDIGHTDATKIMWDGCVLTKLTGNVRHKNMKIDLFFTFKNTVPYRAVSYTPEAVLDLVSVLGIVVFMFGFPILAAWDQRTVQRNEMLTSNKTLYAAEKILLLLCICIHIMIWPYLLMGKKIETVAIESEWHNFIFSAHSALSEIELEEDTTDRELIDQLREVEDLKNPFTKKAVVLEESPGNITVKRKHGLIEGIKLFRWDSTFIYFPLP